MVPPFAQSPPAALLDPVRAVEAAARTLIGREPSEALDRLCRIGCALLGARGVAMTLVSADDVWMISESGVAEWLMVARGAPMTESFCRMVIAADAPTVAHDTRVDVRFAESAIVREFGMQSYLGAPLRTTSGLPLGAVAALRDVATDWTDADVAFMTDLAAMAATELERRILEQALAEQTAHVQAAIDLNPQIPFVADADGRMLYIVPRFGELTGQPTAPVPADPWPAVVHPDDLAALRTAWDRSVSGGIALDHTARLRTADGRWVHMVWRARAHADAAGRIIRWYGWLEDVEDRVIAEREHRQLALLARSTVDGLYIIDFTAGEYFLSPRFAELLGYDSAAVFTDVASLRSSIHADDLPGISAQLADATKARVPLDTECRIRLRSGEYRWFWVRGELERDETGRETRFAGSISDISRRRETEGKLNAALFAARESESRVRAAFEAFPGALAISDPDTAQIIEFNDTACAMLGYSREEYATLRITDLEPQERRDEVLALVSEVARSSQRVEKRRQHITRNGELRDVQISSTSFVTGGRRLNLSTWLDVTEQLRADDTRRDLEARLRQAQKMEAVGQLAGGVAHDFNNLLTIISGNLEFLHSDLPASVPDDHPVRGDVLEIAQATERARALVRQLLAFSRQQPVHPQIMRLGDLVLSMEAFLRRLIGEEIVMTSEIDDRDAVVLADRGQMEQVLMNLIMNARDAMLMPYNGHPGTGGSMRISVSTDELSEVEAAGWDGMQPGRCVRLEVSDTGHGMDAATQARVFEPFFTTKPMGSGTGLGLATVFGVVRQAGGAVRVHSVEGEGTTFTVRFPAADPGDGPSYPVAQRSDEPHARATVLLVEDETPVRMTARRMLERRGYTVLEARHGADALLVWRDGKSHIDIVVTDLRMPELGGSELAQLLRAESPDLPIVFVSGYADRALLPTIGARESFVEKPFTAEALTAAVYRLLRQLPVG